jgi:hypothetical protein
LQKLRKLGSAFEKGDFVKIRITRSVLASLAFCLAIAVHYAASTVPAGADASKALNFGPEQALGHGDKNPAAPFLRFAPDGRLFAVWTEADDRAAPPTNTAHQHESTMRRMASPMRIAVLASSSNGGKSWSPARQVNTGIEAVQGDENGPKVAFNADKKAFVVWSIPGEKGDITRANIRFAMDDGKGGFTPAQTLNEIKDAGRFPIIETMPDGNLLVAWIDRRIDNPKPRQLYLMKLDSEGHALTKNYQVGEGLCECCKLGMVFADGGKTVYMVDRQVNEKQIRNHVLRKSTDGGATFGAPVEISDDGWQVASCPHSGPSIARDHRGWLHVSWFTLGRSEKEAGIYYSVSKDNGQSFSPRRLVQANTAPEVLYNNLTVGDDDTVYLVWSNLDGNNRAQIFLRTIAPDGTTWSPIQQISNAKGNASRAVLALRKDQLLVAWTETDGEKSRAVVRSAMVRQ